MSTKVRIRKKYLKYARDDIIVEPVGALEQIKKRIRQFKSLSKAIVTGVKVDEKTAERRISICKVCHYGRINDEGRGYCGYCGCKARKDAKTVWNLAAYEEHLPDWGCKHPRRLEGKGWPLDDATRKYLMERREKRNGR